MLTTLANILIVELPLLVATGAFLVWLRLRGRKPTRAFPLYAGGLLTFGLILSIAGPTLPSLQLALAIVSGLAGFVLVGLAIKTWREVGWTRTTRDYVATAAVAVAALFISLAFK